MGGEFIIEDSRLTGNLADAAAGAYLFTRDDGNLIARNLVVLDNDATSAIPSFFRGGGGIQIASGLNSTVLLENSLIARNSSSGTGGGVNVLSILGQTALRQVTVSDNVSFGNGGGIHDLGFNGGATSVLHSTVTGNRAVSPTNSNAAGGGVFSLGGLLTLSHTIVAGNTDETGSADAHADPIGFQGIPGVLEADFSLIGNNTGSGLVQAPLGVPDARGNLIGGAGAATIDALLGPLAINGGSSETHVLLDGSPAIGAGDPNIIFSTSEFDQRGFPFSRVYDGLIDIGAIEQQPQPGDFDGDNDVDGADFLNWQRGFSTIYDAGDLANWEATYGQNAATTVAVSSDSIYVESRAVDQDDVAPPATRLIDAAMASEWLDAAAEEETTSAEANFSTEAPFLLNSKISKRTSAAIAFAEVDSTNGFSVEFAAEDSITGEPWLTNELLERVFG